MEWHSFYMFILSTLLTLVPALHSALPFVVPVAVGDAQRLVGVLVKVTAKRRGGGRKS
jgi:hypothetical protein